jgi:hypothetical protein
VSAESTGHGSTPYGGAESAGYPDAESAGFHERVILTSDEERELYVILKPRESTLQGELDGLLRRIEKSLFSRLTIEEIEKLAERFPSDR